MRLSDPVLPFFKDTDPDPTSFQETDPDPIITPGYEIYILILAGLMLIHFGYKPESNLLYRELVLHVFLIFDISPKINIFVNITVHICVNYIRR